MAFTICVSYFLLLLNVRDACDGGNCVTACHCGRAFFSRCQPKKKVFRGRKTISATLWIRKFTLEGSSSSKRRMCLSAKLSGMRRGRMSLLSVRFSISVYKEQVSSNSHHRCCRIGNCVLSSQATKILSYELVRGVEQAAQFLTDCISS